MSIRWMRPVLLSFFGLLCLPLSLLAIPPMPPPRPPAPPKARPSPPSPDLRQTLVLPIRYVDGSRLAEMLRIFVPREHRDTEIRYSFALHKLLLRAQPPLLQTLKRAAEQMDSPQVQFGVWFYAVSPSDETPLTPSKPPAGVLTAFRQIYPDTSRITVLDHRYFQVTNHDRARIKISDHPSLQGSASDLRLTLHQAPSPASPVVVEIQIHHNETFRTTHEKGSDLKVLTSVHLETKLLIRPGHFVFVGHLPWKLEKGIQKVAVMLKVERLHTPPPSALFEPQTASLGKEAIRSVVQTGSSKFKACYEMALRRNPTLQGRVVVSFAIQADGSVAEAKIAQTTLQDTEVGDCLLHTFRALRFPKPSGQGVVRVTYPLTFHP